MIIRAPRPKAEYYVLKNEIANDARLSWAARGLLIHLLTKPDDWTVSVTALVNQTKGATTKSGRDAVYSLLKELIAAGYVRRTRSRASNGTLGKVLHEVREEPLPPEPHVAHPHLANPTQQSTVTEKVLREQNSAAAAQQGKTPVPPVAKASKSKSAKVEPHPLWDVGVKTLIEASGGELDEKAARALAGLLTATFSPDYAPTVIQEVCQQATEDGEPVGAAELRFAIAHYIEDY
jgi:Fe2+ or Zn2+ uptake regulation protein